MVEEKFRNDEYQVRYKTKIFKENESTENPYLESSVECRGYDLLELAENIGFVEYLFLVFRGRLPETVESQILNRALIVLSMPGVRHPATRAAVVAGVGKTLPESVLPAALLVLNGKHNGAGKLQEAMHFLRSAARGKEDPDKLDLQLQPGFGLHYGSPYIYLDDICDTLIGEQDWVYLKLGKALIESSRKNGKPVGWLWTGLFAALFCDLGIQPRFAPGFMQSICSPCLVAQGMENANQPTTILPFVTDDDYAFAE